MNTALYTCAYKCIGFSSRAEGRNSPGPRVFIILFAAIDGTIDESNCEFIVRNRIQFSPRPRSGLGCDDDDDSDSILKCDDSAKTKILCFDHLASREEQGDGGQEENVV